jgi:predicted nucleotidyltransferase
MNKIRSDFPPELKKFFINLQNYLDTELYFYGSVNRKDYVHGKSDIDIAIFTDNEYSMIAKLQHFLHVRRDVFDKIVWKLEGEMIYGYKIKCDKYTKSKCEIAIYNNDFKEILLNEITADTKMSFFVASLLFILKTVYYTVPLISSQTYSEYKRFLFNKIMVNKKDSVFFLIKENKDNKDN